VQGTRDPTGMHLRAAGTVGVPRSGGGVGNCLRQVPVPPNGTGGEHGVDEEPLHGGVYVFVCEEARVHCASPAGAPSELAPEPAARVEVVETVRPSSEPDADS